MIAMLIEHWEDPPESRPFPVPNTTHLPMPRGATAFRLGLLQAEMHFLRIILETLSARRF